MKKITPIILILIAISLGVFVINPEYDKVKGLQLQKEENQKLLVKARDLEKKRDELKQNYDDIIKLNIKEGEVKGEDVKRLEKLLPDTIDNIRLIIDIDTIARKKGIELSNFQVTKNDSNLEQEEGVVVSKSASGVGTITLKFRMEATYTKFLDFMRDLEKSLRVVDVRVLDLSAGGGASYKYLVEIDTYWLR